MPKLTRRNLLAKSGTGMAAAGVLSVSPGLFKLHGGPTNSVTAKPSVTSKKSSGTITPSVVYIRDAAKGEVVLMIGTQQIVRTDHALVDYISRSASENA